MPITRSPKFLYAPRCALIALCVGLAGSMLVVGCAAPPPPAATLDKEKRPLADAIRVATAGLLQQVPQGSQRERRVAVLDPTLDAGTGQQTNATILVDKAVAEQAAQGGAFEVLPFEATSLAKASHLLTGTLQRKQGGYGVNLALVDLKAGTVVAQSSAMARPEGVDMRPLAYYRDSPVVVKDRVIDGYVRTASTPPGQKADANYLQRIAAATVINDATMLYNAARYREALGEYRSALSMPAGDQIRTLNGLYLSHVKLGQMAEAEEAFGRLVSYAIAANSLGVKFLFNPGSVDFWSDPKVTGAYGMWLRQIAKQTSAAKVCMDVIGHSSATGTEAVNDALSLRRAVSIKRRLGVEMPEVLNRLRTQGMGAKQNIVGTGSDDVVDALDRRVEFAIIDCPA
jgi:outer membrane protein OmpA-like peptidoglycan-associated protein